MIRRSGLLPLVSSVILTVAGCATSPDSTGGGGGKGDGAAGESGGAAGSTGGSQGGASGSQGGTGGAQGGAGGTQGGTGGQAGRGGAGGVSGSGGGGAGGRDAAATGGTGGASDASRPDTSPPGDGVLAELDRFCTPTVKLILTDAAAGQKFVMALGGSNEATIATVQSIGRDICRYLYRAASEVRPANSIDLTVDPNFGAPAGKSGSIGKVSVVFSGTYIRNYTGDLTRELKGILYHEMTHIYQNDDKPEGTWSGLANYYESHGDAVRTHFGFTSCGAPSKSGQWAVGAYCARAHWWLFIENKHPGFLHQLNLQLKGGDGVAWTPAMATSIANQTLDSLWTEYQAAACCAGSTRTCCM